MKKLTFVLGFLFVAAIGITAYATTVVVNNDTKIAVVDQNNDEKPCPEGCTCEKCEKAKADAKAAGTETKADCKKEAKCGDKAEKKACCASKDASKTEGKVEEKTETTTEKK